MTSAAQDHRARLDLDFVTGLRALAACYVLLSHVWYEIWPAVSPPYGYGRRPEGLIAWLTGWLYYGHFGVVVFIVISGFCLMLPVAANGDAQKGGVVDYFRRRAKRIAPPYYFAMALSLLAIHFWIGDKTGAQWDIALPATTFSVLVHLLFLNDVLESTRINYVFWSIAIEAQLYLLFPLLVLMIRRKGLPFTVAVSASAVYGAIFMLELLEVDVVPPQFIGLCAYFVFGVAAAKALTIFPQGLVARIDGRVLLGAAALQFATVAALAASWGFDVAERRFAFLDTLVALATASLLLAATRAETKNVRLWLEQRPLLAVGTFSYSLYLIHAPVLHLIWQYWIRPLEAPAAGQFVLLLAVGAPSSLLAAFLFFLACERPFMSSADRSVFRFADFKIDMARKSSFFPNSRTTRMARRTRQIQR